MPRQGEPVQAEGEDLIVFLRRKRQWDVDNGLWCYRCGSIADIFSPGYRKLCSDCESLDTDKGPVKSKGHIRCPKCHRKFVAWEHFDRVLEEGVHEVMCPECEHDFEIETIVTYSFESPALEPEEKEEEPEEDPEDV